MASIVTGPGLRLDPVEFGLGLLDGLGGEQPGLVADLGGRAARRSPGAAPAGRAPSDVSWVCRLGVHGVRAGSGWLEGYSPETAGYLSSSD